MQWLLDSRNGAPGRIKPKGLLPSGHYAALWLFLLVFSALLTSTAAAALPSLSGQARRPDISWQTFTSSDLPTDAAHRLGLSANAGGFLLRVSITPPPEHYLYAPFSPGQSEAQRLELAELGMPLSVSLLNPDGRAIAGAQVFYPPGVLKYDPFSDAELPVYNSQVDIIAVLPALGQSDAEEHRLILNLEALLCSDSACTPVHDWREATLDPDPASYEPLPATYLEKLAAYRTIPEVAAGIARRDETTEAHSGASDQPLGYAEKFAPQYFQQGLEVSGLGRAVLFGLLAGLILNFMPCVLPVVTLKLGTLVGLGGLGSMQGDSESARRVRARFRSYSIFFSLGVLAWFAALFVIIGLAGMMWGQFFQSQTLLLALALLLFLLALSLFGVFRLPVLHPKADTQTGQSPGGQAPSAKSGLRRQAFSGGLLATLLATPCSGPLLGGVLAWAVGQPLYFLGLTLLSVGLGMASPFILLSLRPGLARFLPRPGNWMLTLEKLMGFILMATVLYLLSMLPGDKTIVFLAALLLLGFAAWLWGRKAVALRLLASFATLCALYLAFCAQPEKNSGDAAWQPFEATSFGAMLGERNLLLDFTADWCINCRVMEATTLSDGNREKWARQHNLTYIRVDVTRNNAAGEELLAAMGSASIPVIAIFPAGPAHANPTVLRDLVTSGQLEEALKAALP